MQRKGGYKMDTNVLREIFRDAKYKNIEIYVEGICCFQTNYEHIDITFLPDAVIRVSKQYNKMKQDYYICVDKITNVYVSSKLEGESIFID